MRRITASFIMGVITVAVAASSALGSTHRTASWGPNFVGQNSNGTQEQGVAANMEIGAPSFSHHNPTSYLDEYVGLTDSAGNYFRAGIQYSSSDVTPNLYFSKNGNVTVVGSVAGSAYRQVRVRNYDPNNGVIAEWLTGGVWTPIPNGTWTGMHCTTGCTIDVGTRVIDSNCSVFDPSSCPAQNAPDGGSGFNYDTIQYRPSQGVWKSWSSANLFASTSIFVDPYQYNAITQYYKFNTPRSG